MRVAIVSTYPPRRCGLATFTADLRSALNSADHSTEVLVAAVLDEEPEDTASEVVLTLSQHERQDYARAARTLNSIGVDVVLVEHEYGIFGGESGEYLVDLVEALTVPYVVTLHTLLREPSPQQRAVLHRVVGGATQVTVFTAMARDQVVRSGLAPWERVAVVNHGAPEHLQHAPRERAAGRFARRDGADVLPELAAHGDRRVLSTFGLLSPGKGLEVAVRALASVVRRHPDVLYVVAGRTHPEVVRREGERYRTMLAGLTSELSLDEHVLFVDRYLSDDDIRSLLLRTELFLTPYRAEEQIVSGVLTFALVAGCPVVSTPYFYATELLSTGAGRLVGFDDHEAMAAAVVDLLGDEASLQDAALTAHEIGTQYTWPEVGRETLKVLGSAVHARDTARREGSAPGGGAVASPPLTHLQRLVEPGGIVQHAVGPDPDRGTGYCVDDVARLGLVADALARRDPRAVDMGEATRRSVDFLGEAWDPRRRAMRNLRAVDGRWLDQPHPGDHLGRAIWALGEIAGGPGPIAQRSRGLLRDLVSAEPDLSSPRAAAFAVLGLSRLPLDQLGEAERGMLHRLGGELAALYSENASPEWQWFEDELTYDNGRLAQALVAAAASVRNAEQLRLGLEALEWYCAQCRADDTVVLVGNHWRRRGDASEPVEQPGSERPAGDEGDEQPLDAAALVEACAEAFRVTGSTTYCERSRNAFAWFHGRNRWGLALYDEVSGGCHDGVGPGGLNANQGAESTLAYLQAWLALDSVGLGRSGGHG